MAGTKGQDAAAPLARGRREDDGGLESALRDSNPFAILRGALR